MSDETLKKVGKNHVPTCPIFAGLVTYFHHLLSYTPPTSASLLYSKSQFIQIQLFPRTINYWNNVHVETIESPTVEQFLVKLHD